MPYTGTFRPSKFGLIGRISKSKNRLHGDFFEVEIWSIRPHFDRFEIWIYTIQISKPRKIRYTRIFRVKFRLYGEISSTKCACTGTFRRASKSRATRPRFRSLEIWGYATQISKDSKSPLREAISRRLEIWDFELQNGRNAQERCFCGKSGKNGSKTTHR